MEIQIGNDLRSQIVQDMMRAEPEECCGYITKDMKYVSCANVHEDPIMGFRMTPEDSRNVSMDDDIIAFVHTHPGGLMNPSKTDMETQLILQKPSIIAARHSVTGHIEVFQFGDHLLDMPIEGIMFRHCVYDCYEIVRRFFWQRYQIKLKAFPRDANWWLMPIEHNEDMYDRFFKEAGFVEFDPKLSEPQIGDCPLFKTDGMKVINHAGIYIGNNKIMHHRVGKKSGPAPLSFYHSVGYLTKWVRYERSDPARLPG